MVSPSSLYSLTIRTLRVTLMSRAFCCPRKVSVDEAYRAGQMVMGRAGQRLGVMHPGSPEDKRFRGYFGVSAEVAVEAWEMMVEHDFLPRYHEFLHYLWALAFMRLYPGGWRRASCGSWWEWSCTPWRQPNQQWPLCC